MIDDVCRKRVIGGQGPSRGRSFDRWAGWKQRPACIASASPIGSNTRSPRRRGLAQVPAQGAPRLESRFRFRPRNILRPLKGPVRQAPGRTIAQSTTKSPCFPIPGERQAQGHGSGLVLPTPGRRWLSPMNAPAGFFGVVPTWSMMAESGGCSARRRWPTCFGGRFRRSGKPRPERAQEGHRSPYRSSWSWLIREAEAAFSFRAPGKTIRPAGECQKADEGALEARPSFCGDLLNGRRPVVGGAAIHERARPLAGSRWRLCLGLRSVHLMANHRFLRAKPPPQKILNNRC